MKAIVKKIISGRVLQFFRSLKQSLVLWRCSMSDRAGFMRYSSIWSQTDRESKLRGRLSMAFHTIEKGLTMPGKRLGFGRELVMNTVKLCGEYAARGYDTEDDQFLHALSVLDEYRKLHRQNGYELPPDMGAAIDRLLAMYSHFPETSQPNLSRAEYFAHSASSFDLFSESRHSIRNFSTGGGLDMSKIEAAVAMACNTPSSCNRQPSRVHIVADKAKIGELLKIQRGNRGFGHLADKVIVVTADTGVYAGGTERNAPYIDGGMYGMNLLYALHFHKVGACTLNCYFTPGQQRRLRSLLGIPKAEVFVMVILVGDVPDHISVAISKRQCNMDKIMTTIGG